MKRFVSTVAAILLALLLWAQPAHAAATKIASGCVVQSGGNNAVSSAFDSTASGGAALLVAYVSDVAIAAIGSISDSKSMTWNALTTYTAGGLGRNKFWWASPTGASQRDASHTITYTATGTFGSMCWMVLTDSAGTTSLDAESGNATASSGTSLQVSASITPAASGEVIIVGCGSNNSGADPYTWTDSNHTFTKTDHQDLSGGNGNGAAIGWENGAATNASQPTCNGFTATGYGAVAQAAFVVGAPAGAGGATSHPCGSLRLLGVGCEAQP